MPAGVLTSKAQNVYKAGTESSPLIFIPGTYPELTVTIDYTVRTQDANLANNGTEGTWTKVRQKIQKTITFAKPVELNKQYSLLMHLGLTSVKFDASVSDWDVVGTETSGTPSGLIEGAEIHLPINVGAATAALTFPTSNETQTVNVAGSATTLELTIEGLTNSESYTVGTLTGTVTGDNFSEAATFTADATGKKTFNLTLAPNTGTSNVTRSFTITNASSVAQTINIVQAPQPLVAVIASPFNAELENTAQASAALFTSLKSAAGITTTLTVKQERNSEQIIVTPAEMEFAAEDTGYQEFTVTANGHWSITGKPA